VITTTVITRIPVIRWKDRDNKACEYKLTETDILDLTRSAWREGEPVTAVVHALLQRYVATHPVKKWPSLSLFLRDYVQPINPRWFTTGDLHMKALAAMDQKKRKDEIERAKNRERYAITPLTKIPARYRQIVQAVLSGGIKTPAAQAQHFVASQAPKTMSAEKAKKKADSYGLHKSLGKALDVGVGFGQAVNWFYRGSKSVPSITLSMGPKAKLGGSTLPLLGLALAGYTTLRLLG